jgi:hypothetical protein
MFNDKVVSLESLVASVGTKVTSITNLSFYLTVPCSGLIWMQAEVDDAFFMEKSKLNCPELTISIVLVLFSLI